MPDVLKWACLEMLYPRLQITSLRSAKVTKVKLRKVCQRSLYTTLVASSIGLSLVSWLKVEISSMGTGLVARVSTVQSLLTRTSRSNTISPTCSQWPTRDLTRMDLSSLSLLKKLPISTVNMWYLVKLSTVLMSSKRWNQLAHRAVRQRCQSKSLLQVRSHSESLRYD